MKIYGMLPFWPFSHLTQNSLLLSAPYSDLDKASVGGQFKSLIRVEKGKCRPYIETWEISSRRNFNIFRVWGVIRRATDSDIRKLLKMLKASSSAHFDDWLNDVRLRSNMDTAELTRIKQIASEL